MLEEATRREIVAVYKAGGHDSEAIAVLCKHVQGFRPSQFNEWLADDVEFSGFIEDCRVLARAAWDKRIREGAYVLPDWYYSPPSEAVRELITLACRAAETCPVGSSEREREFKNVERLLAVCQKGS